MNERELYPGWETVRKIGSGSFGAVYEIARTLPNGKTEKAALKVITIPQNEGDVEELYSSGYDDASITAHFKSYLADIVNEYSLMAEIKGHTNVVYCDDIRYIQHDNGFGWDIFIKMELLTPLMKVKEPGAVEDTVKKLGADICSALVLCREKNIVHRDIKPQNIFVSEHGDYKLGDFGIAKTVEKTTGGTKIGTYGYMAPEVYNNQPYGAAADIYSLGLVMYWLLNEHRLPFLPMPPKVPTSTENEQARLRRFRGEPLPFPQNGSTELKRIVLKACAYDPKERYHTADEMLADLNALKGGRAITKTNDSCCWNEGDTTEITNVTSGETVGVFGTGRGRVAATEVGDYSCQIENKTAQTVGIKWKNEREESQLAEKPSKKRRHKILPIAAAVILICTVCGAYGYMHCWFGHSWKKATYDKPKTCKVCGIITGTSLKEDLAIWKEGDWTWSLDKNGVLTISGNGNTSNFDMDGTPWSGWNGKTEAITRVVVEKGITGIGKHTFSFCNNLTDVIFPSSLRFIEGRAFFGCMGLTSLSIPDGVVSIGWQAFAECHSLKSVRIPKSVGIIEEAFLNCVSLTDIYYAGSETQWKKLGGNKDIGVPESCTIHYNSC